MSDTIAENLTNLSSESDSDDELINVFCYIRLLNVQNYKKVIS